MGVGVSVGVGAGAVASKVAMAPDHDAPLIWQPEFAVCVLLTIL